MLAIKRLQYLYHLLENVSISVVILGLEDLGSVLFRNNSIQPRSLYSGEKGREEQNKSVLTISLDTLGGRRKEYLPHITTLRM